MLDKEDPETRDMVWRLLTSDVSISVKIDGVIGLINHAASLARR